MTTLCKPSVHLPEHVIRLEETLALCDRLHSTHPQLPLARRLIANTEVEERHLVRPIEEILVHPGFEARNRIYVDEAKARIPSVVADALRHARLAPDEIGTIIFVSCTGFTMPSLTAWMINELGFQPTTRQVPIAQLGCAAGGAAINLAGTLARAQQENVLIVACEFCSLCYQPTDLEIGNLLSNGLFGDAVAAAVVRADDLVPGFRVEQTASYVVPNTEDWISYDMRATGFHFRLDRRVPRTMEALAPVMDAAARKHGWSASELGLYVIHAGGPRILDDLARFLGVDPYHFRFSRATLRSCGNIASAVVFDALRRAFDSGEVAADGPSVIAGFGPGITAEICFGTCTWPQFSATGTIDLRDRALVS